jgi:hypothetical protein
MKGNLMNCWDALCLILGEEALHITHEEDCSDSVAGKINVLVHWEVLWHGTGMFAVTDRGHGVVVLPTLASTDPLHLAIAIHEAHHAKGWLKHKRMNDRGIILWWEEKVTNRESIRFAKTIATGQVLEDMIGVFKISTCTYGPLFKAQQVILKRLMQISLFKGLTLMMLDHQCLKKTGNTFEQETLKRQARLMNLPEMQDREPFLCAGVVADDRKFDETA